MFLHVVAVVGSLCLFYSVTTAYPTRAGHCMAGPLIGEESGGVHGRDGMGSLADANFALFLDGLRLNATSNTTTTSFAPELFSNTPYNLTLRAMEGTDVSFRGFLIRVSGRNGEDVAESIQVLEPNQTQLLPSTGQMTGFNSACAKDVAGLCHTSPQDKTSITAELFLNRTAQVRFDVTVVTDNLGGGLNNWTYSSFDVDFINPPTERIGLRQCSWWCSEVPIPWVSSDPSVYAKCEWTYSCSICPECLGAGVRR